MGKVDTVRMLVAVGDEERWGRGRPELLELLAAGHPPAFATDSRERIVFWNAGASEVLGHRADDVVGKRCHEVLAGRDVFGNRFCGPNCAVTATLRGEEPVCPFEIEVTPGGQTEHKLVGVTLIKVPSIRPDLFTLVHLLQPIDEEARLARSLARLHPDAPAEPAALAAPAPSAPASPASAAPASLTPREREVLACISEGLQNKEIASRLDLSVATVRNHIHNVLDKLGVHSKLEAVALAFRNGWIERAADR